MQTYAHNPPSPPFHTHVICLVESNGHNEMISQHFKQPDLIISTEFTQFSLSNFSFQFTTSCPADTLKEKKTTPKHTQQQNTNIPNCCRRITNKETNKQASKQNAEEKHTSKDAAHATKSINLLQLQYWLLYITNSDHMYFWH